MKIPEKHKNIIYNLVACILVISSCFLYFRSHLDRILYPDKYILVCSDFWQYLSELEEYWIENSHLIDLLKVGEEPGIFMVATNLSRISNIPSWSILTLLSMIMYCMISISIFAISKKIDTKHWDLCGILSILIYFSLYWNLASHMSGIWRQMLGNTFLIMLILIGFYEHKKRFWVIWSIFLSMCIISHRFSWIIGIGTFILWILYLIYKRKNIKKYLLVLLVASILCLPYIFVFFEYIKHFMEYQALLWDKNNAEDFIKTTNSDSLWYSFYWGDKRNYIPILHYIFYQSWVIIVWLAFLKKSLTKIRNITYLCSLILIISYISYKFNFSLRALLSFEIILVPIVWINIFSNYWRQIRILVFAWIFLLGMLMVWKSILSNIRTKNIESDKGITFLREKIQKDENHFFMGSSCTSDLMSQLHVTSFLNFHMWLHNMNEKKKNWEFDMYDVEKITKLNIEFLWKNGVLLDFFNDKNTYIIFTDRDWVNVKWIQSGQSSLLWKEYLKMIYPENINKPDEWMIKYIFEVNKNLINYANALDYLYKNINISNN